MSKPNSSLAGEYRPRFLDEVLGQERAVRSIRNFLIGKELPNGQRLQLPPVILIAGTTGCGKTTLARIIAAAATCKDFDLETCRPCGTCDDCETAFKGDADGSNYMFLDGGGTGLKETVETDLRRFVHNSPFARGRKRVCVADEAQGLSKGARETLLTLTENLPASAHIIFTTTDAEAIDAAILTRCAPYYLSPLTPEQLREGIIRKCPELEGSDSRLGLDVLVEASAGSMRQLWQWIQLWQSLCEPLTESVAMALTGGAVSGDRQKLWTGINVGDFSKVEATWRGLLKGGAVPNRLASQLAQDIFDMAAANPLARDWTGPIKNLAQAQVLKDPSSYIAALMGMVLSPARPITEISAEELASAVALKLQSAVQEAASEALNPAEVLKEFATLLEGAASRKPLTPEVTPYVVPEVTPEVTVDVTDVNAVFDFLTKKAS